MALSDEERRVLEEMERHLTSQSADVVDMGGSRRANLTLVTVGILTVAAGLAVVISGVVFRIPLLGIAGFGAMVVGALTSLSKRRDVTALPRSSRSPRRSSLEDRWDRRIDGEL